MVVFAGNTPSYHHAREAHQSTFPQYASQADIYKPFNNKRVWRVDDAKFFPDVIPRALNLARPAGPASLYRRADGCVCAEGGRAAADLGADPAVL